MIGVEEAVQLRFVPTAAVSKPDQTQFVATVDEVVEHFDRFARALDDKGKIVDATLLHAYIIRIKPVKDECLETPRIGVTRINGVSSTTWSETIAVIAGTADECVVAGTAVEDIVAAIASDGIGGRVTGSIDGTRASERQVFEVGTERAGHARLNEVGAFIGVLGNDIARTVDHIGVVAGTPDHRIGTGLAIKDIVPRIARQSVIQVVTHTLQGILVKSTLTIIQKICRQH